MSSASAFNSSGANGGKSAQAGCTSRRSRPPVLAPITRPQFEGGDQTLGALMTKQIEAVQRGDRLLQCSLDRLQILVVEAIARVDFAGQEIPRASFGFSRGALSPFLKHS